MKKFWHWVKNEAGRTLYFDGYIAQDSWFDDDITPKKFKAELNSAAGDSTVWLNSPGGDVFAASQIYTKGMFGLFGSPGFVYVLDMRVIIFDIHTGNTLMNDVFSEKVKKVADNRSAWKK